MEVVCRRLLLVEVSKYDVLHYWTVWRCNVLSVLYGYRVSFLGVKRPEPFFDHSPQYSVEFKEIVQLYLYSPWGFYGILGDLYFTFLPYHIQRASVRFEKTDGSLEQSNGHTIKCTCRNTPFFSYPGKIKCKSDGHRAAFLKLFQVGTTFISQNVLRTTLLLGLSHSLGMS